MRIIESCSLSAQRQHVERLPHLVSDRISSSPGGDAGHELAPVEVHHPDGHGAPLRAVTLHHEQPLRAGPRDPGSAAHDRASSRGGRRRPRRPRGGSRAAPDGSGSSGSTRNETVPFSTAGKTVLTRPPIVWPSTRTTRRHARLDPGSVRVRHRRLHPERAQVRDASQHVSGVDPRSGLGERERERSARADARRSRTPSFRSSSASSRFRMSSSSPIPSSSASTAARALSGLRFAGCRASPARDPTSRRRRQQRLFAMRGRPR